MEKEVEYNDEEIKNIERSIKLLEERWEKLTSKKVEEMKVKYDNKLGELIKVIMMNNELAGRRDEFIKFFSNSYSKMRDIKIIEWLNKNYFYVRKETESTTNPEWNNILHIREYIIINDVMNYELFVKVILNEIEENERVERGSSYSIDVKVIISNNGEEEEGYRTISGPGFKELYKNKNGDDSTFLAENIKSNLEILNSNTWKEYIEESGLKKELKVTFYYNEFILKIINRGINGKGLAVGLNSTNYKKRINKFYISYDYKTYGEDDCLLSIITNVKKLGKINSKKIREKLGVNTVGPIKIEDIHKFEEMFNVRINILKDEKKFEKIICDDEEVRIEDKDIKNCKTKIKEVKTYIYCGDKSKKEVINCLYEETNEIGHLSHIQGTFDDYVKYCHVCGYIDKIDGDYLIKHSLKKCYDNLIKDGRLKANISVNSKLSKKKEKKDRLLMMYDLETLYEYMGAFEETKDLKAYSHCFMIFDKQGKFIEMDYKVGYDIENMLLQFLDVSLDKYVIIAYNGSKFDFWKLFEVIIKRGYSLSKNNMTVHNGRLLRLNYKGHTIWDLCLFVKETLKDACLSYKTEHQKIEMDHNEKRNEYILKGKYKFIEDEANNCKLKEYNINDVKAMSELFFKYQKVMKKLFNDENIDITKFTTLSQLVYQQWIKRIINNGLDIISLDKNEDKKSRKSMYGGRVQNFGNKHMYSGPLLLLDICSLYPFVMETYLYPIGNSIKTDKYIDLIYNEENKEMHNLGIYKCAINQKSLNLNVIPLKTKKNLDWTYKEDIICWLNSIDINQLRKYGAKCEIMKGFYWKDTSYLFKDFIQEFKKEKMNQDELKDKGDNLYNPALREVCKLIMNALSGKVGQRNVNTDFCFCKNRSELWDFEANHKNITFNFVKGTKLVFLQGNSLNGYDKNRAKPSYLGSFIYSYARRHMYNNVYMKVEPLLGDTDSCLIYLRDFKFISDMIGNDFGKLKIEYGGDFKNNILNNGIINYVKVLRTKEYMVKTQKKYKNKYGELVDTDYKFKGVGKKDIWFYVEKNNKSEIDFSKEDFRVRTDIIFEDGISENLYDKILFGHKVYSLTYQIRRSYDDEEDKKMKIPKIYIRKIIKDLSLTSNE